MAVVGMPALPPEESAALEQDYRHHPSRLVRQRSQILLLCADLDSRTEVARAVRCSYATVQRTLNLYQAGGRGALRERRGTRGTPHFHRRTLAWQKTLALAMEAGPEACGVPRPAWSVPLLVPYLAEQTGIVVSERTVGRGLASLGYVCRRGTWTVRHRAEEDPEYHPKRQGSRRS